MWPSLPLFSIKLPRAACWLREKSSGRLIAVSLIVCQENSACCCAPWLARLFSGCKSHPATFASAGSNRSSRGGDEAGEAFGVKGQQATRRACGLQRERTLGRPRKSQCGSRPACRTGKAASPRGRERNKRPGFRRGSGGSTHARGQPEQHGKPSAWSAAYRPTGIRRRTGWAREGDG